MDKRVTPARPDIAAAHLKDQVVAERFVEGEVASIAVGRTSLRVAPSPDAAQDSELLFGESFTVYDMQDGWAWGQAARDSYVGYVDARALSAPFATQGVVTALSAPLFPAADFKKPVLDFLPLNAAVPVLAREGDYVRIHAEGLYLHQRHLAPLDTDDFVTVAERFVGTPYVWGGKTHAGLDCSGLVQAALHAVGQDAPRDTDMQEAALGAVVSAATQRGDVAPKVRRGDLVFWRGHVGVMLDATRLLHANAFHMQVAIEPLADAVARIASVVGPVTGIRRV